MTRLMLQLVQWGLARKPLRTLFLLLTVIGSLAAFITTEAVMRDIAIRSIGTWRFDPYDITVTGSNVYDLEDRISKLAGVSKVERTIMFDVVSGAKEVPVVVPGAAHTLLPLEYSEGRTPQNEHEIAVSSDVAYTQLLKIGDTVQLALRSDLENAVPYKVSGILGHKQGLARVNVLTMRGAERVQVLTSRYDTLLVLNHPSASQGSVQRAIRSLAPNLTTIKLYNQDFGPGLSIAESIISLTKMLLLGVATISLYMLFYLGQQERAYELGVLRALGFSKRKVLTTLVVEGALIIVAGGLLGFVVLLIVASLLNMGSMGALLAEYGPSGGFLLGLGLLAVFMTARFFASQPITSLIKDR